jgi:hypothetical protein
MPIFFKERPAEIQAARVGRGGHFDKSIIALARDIRPLQKAGILSVREIAKELNNAGLVAPSGGEFTYTSMRRVLRRLEELNLAKGPRTLFVAANQRPPPPSAGRPGRSRQLSPAWKRARDILPPPGHE